MENNLHKNFKILCMKIKRAQKKRKFCARYLKDGVLIRMRLRKNTIMKKRHR
jgi:hypothetical protein